MIWVPYVSCRFSQFSQVFRLLIGAWQVANSLLGVMVLSRLHDSEIIMFWRGQFFSSECLLNTLIRSIVDSVDCCPNDLSSATGVAQSAGAFS